MTRWLRRARAAFGMGLTWALAWGLGVGGAIELVGNIWPNAPIVGLVDIWPTTLAIPGFIAGACFSLVLGLAERRRRFEELSIPRFAALGAAGGLLAGAITVGLIISAAGAPAYWIQAVVVAGVPTVLSTLSAAGTLALARRAASLPEPPRPEQIR